MITLDKKTKKGARVTDGKMEGTIYGFGDGLNENNFMVIVDWDNGEIHQYVLNSELSHLIE